MKLKRHQNQNEERYVVRSKRLRSLLYFIFILLAVQATATKHWNYTDELLALNQENYKLRLLPARDSLMTITRYDPDNVVAAVLLHTNFWLQAFVTEEAKDYDRYIEVRDSVLDVILKLPADDPHRKLAQSDIYLYSGILNSKFNDFYSAARAMKEAYDLIEENHDAYPDLILNHKNRGLVKVYLSTVPDNYLWVTRILGIEGDLRGGLRLMRGLAHTTSDDNTIRAYAHETAYLYAFSLYHIARDNRLAWSETLNITRDHRNSLLSTYFRANLALRTGKNETALKVLEERPQGDEYFPFPMLEYMTGLAKLRKLDASAIDHLVLFESGFKGMSFRKSCAQLKSWHYLVHGDSIGYEREHRRIASVGYDFHEQDKQALIAYRKPRPDIDLLKARLLYDGGYYKQALDQINGVDHRSLSTNMKAEYCYRKGRIFEQLGHDDVAMKFYVACAKVGKHSDEYYASYASIYLAEHYLELGDLDKAEIYFDQAMQMKENEEYRNSIEQRVKQGIKEIRSSSASLH